MRACHTSFKYIRIPPSVGKLYTKHRTCATHSTYIHIDMGMHLSTGEIFANVLNPLLRNFAVFPLISKDFTIKIHFVYKSNDRFNIIIY